MGTRPQSGYYPFYRLFAPDLELTPEDLREIELAAAKIAIEGARLTEKPEALTNR